MLHGFLSHDVELFTGRRCYRVVRGYEFKPWILQHGPISCTAAKWRVKIHHLQNFWEYFFTYHQLCWCNYARVHLSRGEIETNLFDSHHKYAISPRDLRARTINEKSTVTRRCIGVYNPRMEYVLDRCPLGHLFRRRKRRVEAKKEEITDTTVEPKGISPPLTAETVSAVVCTLGFIYPMLNTRVHVQTRDTGTRAPTHGPTEHWNAVIVALNSTPFNSHVLPIRRSHFLRPGKNRPEKRPKWIGKLGKKTRLFTDPPVNSAKKSPT